MSAGQLANGYRRNRHPVLGCGRLSALRTSDILDPDEAATRSMHGQDAAEGHAEARITMVLTERMQVVRTVQQRHAGNM